MCLYCCHLSQEVQQVSLGDSSRVVLTTPDFFLWRLSHVSPAYFPNSPLPPPPPHAGWYSWRKVQKERHTLCSQHIYYINCEELAFDFLPFNEGLQIAIKSLK